MAQSKRVEIAFHVDTVWYGTHTYRLQLTTSNGNKLRLIQVGLLYYWMFQNGEVTALGYNSVTRAIQAIEAMNDIEIINMRKYGEMFE